MSFTDILQDKTTVLVLIAIGVVLLLGVLLFRYKFSSSSTSAESFSNSNSAGSAGSAGGAGGAGGSNDNNIHCDEVTGICQRVPKSDDISEAEMEAAQQKMESELREDEQISDSQ
jgi:hypothetical protein